MRPLGWFLPVMVAATLFTTARASGIVANSSRIVAPGAWVIADTMHAALKPWAIPGYRYDGTSWLDEGVSWIADSVLSVRWGRKWESGPPPPPSWADCRRFEAETETDLPVPVDYWVFACKKTLVGGDWQTYYYLLGDGSSVTQERTDWRIDFGAQVSESVAVRRYRELYDTLVPRLAGIILSSESEDERKLGWKMGRRFHTREGSVEIALGLYGDPPTYKLQVERESKTLESETDRYWGQDFTLPGAEVGRKILVLREVAQALEAVDADLARALRKPKPVWNDGARFVGAFDRVRSGGTAGESADLVLLAAHTWIGLIADSLGAGGPDWARTVQVWARHGIRFAPDPEIPTDSTYCASILKALARRAGADRWTDEAFAQWLEQGAVDNCFCTEDRMDSVIEKGNEFLRDHPGSSAYAAVERAVAEAHETLWSLSLSKPDNSYSQALALTGAAHRDRSLALYHDVLKRAPKGWDLELLRRRVRRIEIGVDTAQRAFVCWSD